MQLLNAPYRREPSGLAARSILSALRARGRLLALISGILFAVLAALILTMPEQYESRMEMFLGERNPSPAWLAASEKINRASYLHDVLVNSEIELLRSTDVLSNVVLKTGLQKLEATEDGSSGVTNALTFDKALRRLQRNLKITAVEKSNILRVSYSAPTPELAQSVLKTLAASYPARRIEVRSQPGTVAFLRRQSIAWREVLTKSETDLIRCRRVYSGFVLPEERTAFSKRALEAQSASEQADAQTAECQQRVSKEEKELAQYLSQRQSRTYANRGSRTIHAPYEPNVLTDTDLSGLQRKLVADRAELSGLQTLRDRLKRIAGRYRQDLFNLAGASIEHDALQRQLKESADNYLMYSKKEEETRLTEALARGQVADVSLADGPTLPFSPSNPRLPEDLLLALLCSLGCGAAGVMIVEFCTVGSLRSYRAVRSLRYDF